MGLYLYNVLWIHAQYDFKSACKCCFISLIIIKNNFLALNHLKCNFFLVCQTFLEICSWKVIQLNTNCEVPKVLNPLNIIINIIPIAISGTEDLKLILKRLMCDWTWVLKMHLNYWLLVSYRCRDWDKKEKSKLEITPLLLNSQNCFPLSPYIQWLVLITVVTNMSCLLILFDYMYLNFSTVLLCF